MFDALLLFFTANHQLDATTSSFVVADENREIFLDQFTVIDWDRMIGRKCKVCFDGVVRFLTLPAQKIIVRSSYKWELFHILYASHNLSINSVQFAKLDVVLRGEQQTQYAGCSRCGNTVTRGVGRFSFGLHIDSATKQHSFVADAHVRS